MNTFFMQFATYSKMIKISHTLFAMPFAVAAIVLAIAQEYREASFVDGSSLSVYGFVWDTVFIVLAVAFARSVAMGLNRVVDSGIDRRNPRTSEREIPSGKISNRVSLLFVVVSVLGYVGSAFALSPLCFALSPIPLFLFMLYSYSKRFTALCHFILGLSLAIAPIGAFIAITGELSFGVLILSSSVLVWTAGFDIIYSLQDMDFDKKEQLHSIPAMLGYGGAVGLSRLLHILFVSLLALSGLVLGLGLLFYVSVLIVGVLIVWQHLITRRQRGVHYLMQAFNVNIYISIVVMLGVFFDVVL